MVLWLDHKLQYSQAMLDHWSRICVVLLYAIKWGTIKFLQYEVGKFGSDNTNVESTLIFAFSSEEFLFILLNTTKVNNIQTEFNPIQDCIWDN